MDFWDEQHGIAFSDPMDGHLFIITTDNGGETWQEVPKENIPPVVDGEAGFAASGTCLTRIIHSISKSRNFHFQVF